jgi:antirestriction protein ArdC
MQAFNFATMTPYSGKNAATVGNGELPAFATFQQIKGLGYQVRKGAKGISIFCGFREKTVENGKTEKVPKFAIVFDLIDTTANDDKEFLKYVKTELKKLFK